MPHRNKEQRDKHCAAYRSKNRAKNVAATRSWSQRNPEKARAKNRRHERKRRSDLKKAAYAAYGGFVCACCGEEESKFLTIDHMNNDGAEHRRKSGGGDRIYKWLHINNYPPGFQILCCNCNRGRWLNGGVCPHKTEVRMACQEKKVEAERAGTGLGAVRKLAGLTQEGLAATLGVSRVAVARWESGKAQPHPRTRARVEALLGAIEWPGEAAIAPMNDCLMGHIPEPSKAERIEQAWERLRAAWDNYMEAKR